MHLQETIMPLREVCIPMWIDWCNQYRNMKIQSCNDMVGFFLFTIMYKMYVNKVLGLSEINRKIRIDSIELR